MAERPSTPGLCGHSHAGGAGPGPDEAAGVLRVRHAGVRGRAAVALPVAEQQLMGRAGRVLKCVCQRLIWVRNDCVKLASLKETPSVLVKSLFISLLEQKYNIYRC